MALQVRVGGGREYSREIRDGPPEGFLSSLCQSHRLKDTAQPQDWQQTRLSGSRYFFVLSNDTCYTQLRSQEDQTWSV